jgi:hypothetical protein
MDQSDISITSDPHRLSNQIEFVERMIEKDSERLESVTDEKDMEVLNFVLRISEEIRKSLKELQEIKKNEHVMM